MRVTFWQTTRTGQKELFVLEHDGKRSVRVVSGDKDVAKHLGVLKGPIVGAGQIEYWPKDGRAYMEAMAEQFTGSYIRASKIQEGS